MTAAAITGIGVTSPLGNNFAEFEENALRSTCFLEHLQLEDSRFIAARVTGELEIENPRRFVHSDRSTGFAIHASCQAMADAGLEKHRPDRENFAVFMGSGLAGFQRLEADYEQLFRQNKIRPRPSAVANTMANAPCAHISIEHGITGPSANYATACASSSMAIFQGLSHVREHRDNIALVGGTEAPLNYGQLLGWLASGAYSKSKTDAGNWTSSFAADRNGMALGEGGIVFVIEDLGKVKSQNRPYYAAIAGGALTSNANKIVQSDFNGQLRVMQKALANAGIDADQIDYVNAHATGTIGGDVVEAQAIAALNPNSTKKTAVSSLKGAHGHLLGASGAIGLLATVVGIKNQVFPGNAGCHQVDAQIAELINVPIATTKGEIGTALVNSFAFGGHNCSLVITAPS